MQMNLHRAHAGAEDPVGARSGATQSTWDIPRLPAVPGRGAEARRARHPTYSLELSSPRATGHARRQEHPR
ncbi:hypothetical protein HBB16_12600 [Pseudonocardia sp. MCCB 268]|nr:hypothetical protein [Pseudonocardia cytotoxica]